ncbi:DEAD/DEAH box helicase [Bacillus sp. FJAT-29937]|uniref:DEAD/DEAH box helicase n=1 Tax=Bacillus sp. FJAT-29937 TaxID=1720553 RepID=UPI000837A781|nr:DEAD/DEAH box helicase [Bacillus sp. FJAT-29937]
MNQLELTYRNAVENAKSKILNDITLYLGSKDTMPAYEDYVSERSTYINQLWLNVWLNKSTGSVSRQIKKDYLKWKGYETENLDKKLINHLFRTEMRTYKPFNALEWLNKKWEAEEINWDIKYREAREDFLQKEEERLLHESIHNFQDKFIQEIECLIDKNNESLYLYVRHFISINLINDLKSEVKYKKIDTFALEEKLKMIGAFNSADYTLLSEFLEELTGEIHKTSHWGRRYFEYETYFDRYLLKTARYLKDVMMDMGLNEMMVKGFNLSTSFMQSITDEILAEASEELAMHFIEEAQQEYMIDLIRLSKVPFDLAKHGEIYRYDLANLQRRLEEERAEIERKKEEEKRIINDIFGQEYQPSIRSNIRFVLHIGETNTGKTHHALEKMKAASSGLYLAPLRLLALEVYDKLNEEGTLCSLKTGEEEKIVAGASHISCTVEMFHEKESFDCIVIDEAQMITDKDRGFSWYKAITKANANEVHIIGSHNVKDILLQLLGDASIEIFEYTREVPLEVEKREFKFSRVDKGDALICFSRKKVLETASRLENSGHSVSMIYGSMPPETRKKQVQRFNHGKSSIIVSTDAIGMGINLPIKRVVFLENEKFDGQKRRLLTSQEVKQIAGRAGRKGIYDVGKVAFVTDIHKMWDLLVSEDQPILTFSVAPTSTVFERFQTYYRDLGTFFELWDKFESPKGTKKASLSEERELYEKVRGSSIEAKLSIMDLYGFLHLPFSKKEPQLIWQWEQTMLAIIDGNELPEPILKNRNLEELELSYKAIGLHLLFLYRLDRRTEAIYWERIREQISDKVHDRLRTDVKNIAKKCRSCGRSLPWDHKYQICDQCHERKYRRHYTQY